MFFGDFCAKERGSSTVQLAKQYCKQVTTRIPKRHTPTKNQTPTTRWALTSYKWGCSPYKWSYNPTYDRYWPSLNVFFFQNYSMRPCCRVKLPCRSKVVSTSRKMSLVPQVICISSDQNPGYLLYPNAPCMEYLPTFTINFSQM